MRSGSARPGARERAADSDRRGCRRPEVRGHRARRAEGPRIRCPARKAWGVRGARRASRAACAARRGSRSPGRPASAYAPRRSRPGRPVGRSRPGRRPGARGRRTRGLLGRAHRPRCRFRRSCPGGQRHRARGFPDAVRRPLRAIGGGAHGHVSFAARAASAGDQEAAAQTQRGSRGDDRGAPAAGRAETLTSHRVSVADAPSDRNSGAAVRDDRRGREPQGARLGGSCRPVDRAAPRVRSGLSPR